jgi:YHS domain-containing protein
MEVLAGEGAITLEHEGRQLFFCSSGCRDAFAADPAGHATA